MVEGMDERELFGQRPCKSVWAQLRYLKPHRGFVTAFVCMNLIGLNVSQVVHTGEQDCTNESSSRESK